MSNLLIILMISTFLLVTGLLVLGILLWRRSQEKPADNTTQLLQQQMAANSLQHDQRLGQLSEQLAKAITNLTTQLNERLHQNQSFAQQSQQGITQSLEAAGKTIGELKGQLGQLGQATKQITQVGSEVRKLQDILQSPKLRGSLGEWTLENLLAEVLPQAHYRLQHRFNNGQTVDALVLLAQGSVCIDAKFPLPNFQAMLEAQDDSARARAKRQFLRDVCKRIDEIADKYILPDEGTLDFALMYVPAENVYYQAMITNEGEQDVSAYGRKRKVIPVSPNTLYAYLMVIATGLKGLQIEKNAQIIRRQLSRLDNDLNLFISDFALAGKHIGNAKSKYEDAAKKLDYLAMKLKQMETDSGPQETETQEKTEAG